MDKLLLTWIFWGALQCAYSLPASSTIAYFKMPSQVSDLISGTVYHEGKPLSNSTIYLKELDLYSLSDQQGNFKFVGIPKGTYTLIVQHAGMQKQEVKATVGKKVDIKLQTNSIAIEDVQVVGQVSDNKGATSTYISRQAIEHIQATNLGEVLQLLPGQSIKNPSFSNVNTPSLRQISGSASENIYDAQARNAASLGTSIIINGAQLSNNGNLQAVNTATGGTLSTFSNSTGMGTDLRQISADNIESVEVIRGIPSVEHGDLTAGIINVKTKASVEPLQAKFRLNPTLKQGWIGQGFQIGKDQGALFVDVDYTHSANNQIQTSESYQRINTSLQYTNTFGANKNLYTNTTLAFGGYYDDSKIDPDLVDSKEINQAENYDLRFSTNGRWNLDKRFARNINYVLSTQMGFQNGFQQRYNTGQVSAISSSTENITQEVDFLPSEYLQQIYLDGKPLNIQAKITNNFYLSSGQINHAFMVGGNYSFEKNYGQGRYYADGLPPRVVGGLGHRPRAFSDIPALNQLAFFVEDKLTVPIAGRLLNVVAGLRYDMMQPNTGDFKSAFSPRINASYEIAQGLKIRGGYGMSAKMPSLIYLYPDPAYVDVFSLSYYRENPAERLALMTTRVFDTRNTNLEIAQSKKAELGLDYKKFSLTYFSEHTNNAYDMTQFYNFASIPKYTVESQEPGERPVLSPDVSNVLQVVDYNTPTNGVNLQSKGVEFDFDFGRVAALRTSFTFNGAYVYTKREGNTPYVYARQVTSEPYTRLGVFEARGREYTRFLTTLRGIHHIPEIRLIVSLTAQTIWVDKDRYLNYSSRPYGVIQIEEGGAGKVQLLTASEIAAIPETSGIYLPVTDGYYLEESWKPLWLFNAKVTKEFGKNYGFSFYVNNITNYRPLHASDRNPGQYTKRNIPVFFGSELTFKF